MIGDVSRTRAALTALTLIPTLLVAGCSDDDPKPKFEPPSSEVPSTSSPSPSPSSTIATKREQQTATIEQFVGAISESLATGDPSEFLDLTSDSCQNCRVLADNLSGAYAGGGHIEGGGWALMSSEYQGEKPLGSIWNVDIKSAREQWMDGDGEVVKIVRAGTQHFGVALEESGDGWRVRELRLRG
jgi:hypothetical protein